MASLRDLDPSNIDLIFSLQSLLQGKKFRKMVIHITRKGQWIHTTSNKKHKSDSTSSSCSESDSNSDASTTGHKKFLDNRKFSTDHQNSDSCYHCHYYKWPFNSPIAVQIHSSHGAVDPQKTK